MTRTRLTYAHRPARELLRIAAAEAGAWFQDRISGVFALGSMAHGGFAPEVSDVDIALVFDEIPADAAERVTALAEHVRALVPAEARPLADRLSVFWSDWPHLCRGEGAGRLPAVDRADFLEHGVLLTGHDLRHLCPRPDNGELVVESAHFAARKFGAEPYLALLRSPRRLLAAGAREATRAVLVPARVCRTLATGDVVRSDMAASWYAAQGLPAHHLVTAAATWRQDGLPLDTGDAERLLGRHLPLLHAHLAERIRQTLGPSAGADAVAACDRLTALSRPVS